MSAPFCPWLRGASCFIIAASLASRMIGHRDAFPSSSLSLFHTDKCGLSLTQSDGCRRAARVGAGRTGGICTFIALSNEHEGMRRTGCSRRPASPLIPWTAGRSWRCGPLVSLSLRGVRLTAVGAGRPRFGTSPSPHQITAAIYTLGAALTEAGWRLVAAARPRQCCCAAAQGDPPCPRARGAGLVRAAGVVGG